MIKAQSTYRVELELPFDETVERTVHELGEQGFGVITWIDLRDKLLERLGADFRSYVIMGAFDPSLAQRGLEEELEIGLALPHNVIVYQSSPNHSVVAALAPETAFAAVKDDVEVTKLAQEASLRLRAAIAALKKELEHS